jgi:hypothetical protein
MPLINKNRVNGSFKTVEPPLNLPTMGAVTLTNQINVSVAFTAASQNAAGGINRWYIFRTTTGGVSTDQIVYTSPVVITGLTGSTTYTFSMATANAGGQTAFNTPTSPVTTGVPLSIVSGGTLTSDATYYYRTNATDSWGISVTNFPLVCDILLVGAGGGAGHWESGGGGGGQVSLITDATIPIGGGTFNYGAGGGSGGDGGGGPGGDGNKTWLTGTAYEALGGQGGGGVNTSGRSRAGGASGNNLFAGATPTNAPATAGGGGGAGGSAVGLSGNGGIGVTAFNGVNYGGGGMGGSSGNSANTGGHTYGGGVSNGGNGTANRGGGAAGHRGANGSAGGSGGSGFAIIRYLKSKVE